MIFHVIYTFEAEELKVTEISAMVVLGFKNMFAGKWKYSTCSFVARSNFFSLACLSTTCVFTETPDST
jgi:hypothetical protein